MTQAPITYNDNDPYNSGRVATLVRLSQAGTQPNIGLLHSGVTPVAGATGLQANQMPGSINYGAGGVVSEGPAGVSVPAVPLNVAPNAAATSGPGGGNANQSLLAAMSWGDNLANNSPYQQSPTLGPGIASNAAGVAGGEQTITTSGATELDNVQFTAAPAGTITSLTLTANWPRAPASNYVLALSTGQIIFGVTLTQNATTCTFPSTTIFGSPTVNAVVSQ
jgi:hypothetical protein